MENKEIFCCECQKKVTANKITGETAYLHRKDLYSLVFWRCPHCNNFVGTHLNSKENCPLGHICGKELKNAKIEIHKILDPLWKNKKYKRKELYSMISNEIGWHYHTAMIRNIDEARKVYRIIFKL